MARKKTKETVEAGKDALAGTKTNHVTLFSNGMGHFVRLYKVEAGQPKKISIPFKREYMDQVLASLSVFGNVKYDSAPSFTPTNSNATALQIDSNNAQRSLLKSLSGAEVEVTNLQEKIGPAKLLGIETVNTVVNGNGVSKDFVVVEDGEGTVSRIPLDEVKSVRFTEETVKSEIAKARQNNFQRIKPDSSFLDLVLSGVDITETPQDEDALVQYAIPVAAWKMRYNIRQESGRYLLEGTAIIDNNTDEDWVDFLVSVVTGNPISFRTDLADVTTPTRQYVKLVDDEMMGNVAVAEAMLESVGCAGGGAPRGVMKGFAAAARSAASPAMSPMYSSANVASFGMEAAGGVNYSADSINVAGSPGVDSKEVGDFCVFTSKEPITILSKRSAIVPMFTIPLTTAGSVLLYKEENHSRRPFRAVKFKNESDYSLGKGKVVVYQDGLFSGEGVLEAAKPGENRMIPHCLENGVKIIKEFKTKTDEVNSIRFGKGLVVEQRVHRAVTEYVVENRKDKEFKVLVEHRNFLGTATDTPSFTGTKVDDVEKLASGDGYRAYFVVKAKEKLTLTVTEQFTRSSEYRIDNNYDWFRRYIVLPKHPLVDNAHIRSCEAVQAEIDRVDEEINRLQEHHDELQVQGERVRRNLQATKDEAASKVRSQWVADLDESEQEMRNIVKEQIPDLEAEKKKLQKDLHTELKRLSASWEQVPKSTAKASRKK